MVKVYGVNLTNTNVNNQNTFDGAFKMGKASAVVPFVANQKTVVRDSFRMAA